MENQIIVLDGIIYDYCEDIKFYNMLGFLEKETGTLRGIEVVSESRIDLSYLKEILKTRKNKRLVCGTINGSISYYAIDIENGEIVYTNLKRGLDSYAGREQTLCARVYMEAEDSKYKVASSIQEIQDSEIEVLLGKALNLNRSNMVWNGLQNAADSMQATEKIKVYKGA